MREKKEQSYRKMPNCTDKDSWRRWENVLKTYGKDVRPGRAYFCTDCTPEFAKKHRRTGTCNHPNIVFKFDKDGFIEGRIH